MRKQSGLLVVALLSALLSPAVRAGDISSAESARVVPRYLARESLVEFGSLSSPADQRKAFQISSNMGNLGRALGLREDQQDAWAVFLKETLSAFLASSAPIAIQDGLEQTPEARFALREAIVREHLDRLQRYRKSINVFHGILDKDQQAIFDTSFLADKNIGLEGNPFVAVR